MPPEAQIRALTLAGATGGALRIAAAFIPYTPNSAALETLYATVDLGMMFGLVGIHLRTASRTGAAGFVCFAIALAALASIVGPDATAFDFDFYRVGASIFALSLAGYAVTLLIARLYTAAAVLWIACALIGVIALVTGSTLAFMAAGVALGLGFIAASAPARHQAKQAVSA